MVLESTDETQIPKDQELQDIENLEFIESPNQTSGPGKVLLRGKLNKRNFIGSDTRYFILR